MANPQTWTDPSTGETYELIPDTPEVKTWTDPTTGDTYELIPDDAAQPSYKEADANVTGVSQNPITSVATLAFKNNPEAAALAQGLWNSGVRDPEAFNTAISQKFPQFAGKALSVGDIAKLRERDAWYKARGAKNPGNFFMTEETGIKDPEAPTNVFSAALQGGKRSLENMANSATGLSALVTDVVGAEETSDYLLNKYIEDQKAIQFNNPSAVQRASDIGSIGDAAMYGADVLGELVPQITSSMGMGLAGSALGKKAAGRFIADATEEQVTKAGMKGMAASTLASTSSQETGSIYGDTYRETGVRAPVSSVIAGLAAGALDTITPIRALTRLGVPTEAVTGRMASRLAKEGIKDFAIEGGTEAAQTFIEGLPKAVVTGESPFTAEMLDNVVEAFIRGGIGGGVVGTASEYLRPTTQPAAEPAATDPNTVPPAEEEPSVEDDSPLPFTAPDFLEKPVKGPFKETPSFLNTPAPKQGKKGRAAPVETPTVPNLAVNKQQAADHINNVLASDWKNAPRITAVDSLDELPPAVRQSIIDDGAEDAKGVTVDGEVYILSHNLKDIDDLSAVTYHEALGHAGLGMQFGTRLNAVLEQMYNTNQMVKDAADAWLAKNNTQSTNPVAHAVEEILAETSEGGKIDAKIMAKIKAFLKQYARRVPGLKNLKYTDKEVFAILSIAQNKIVKGNKTFFGINEVRYNKADNDNPKLVRQPRPKVLADNIERETIVNPENTFNLSALSEREAWDNADLLADEFGLTPEQVRQQMGDDFPEGWAKYPNDNRYSKPEEGEERPRGLRWDKLEGRNNNYLKPLFKEMQKDIPEKNRQSWEETERLAEEMGMNYDKAKKLNRGPEVEEVEAVRMWAVGKGNLLEELGKKIQDGRATPREKDQYVIHLKQLVDIFDVFAEFSSKQGRGLNILRKVSINNKKAVNNVRYMLSRNGRDALDDDTRTKLLLDAVEDLQKNAGETLKRGHSKAYGFVMNALNLPRSIMSSLDFSAPLRQGVFLVGRKEFYKNLGRMFKAFGSERVYQEMMESIKSRPSYKMMKDSGLYVSDLDRGFTTREEAFMSQWAEKIPGLGKGIRASERAYSGFLNMLRADTFDTLVTKFKEANPESEFDEKRLSDLAGFINNATGRGKMLQDLEAAAPMLNALFFSPRLIASRVNLLNPAYYIKLDPMVRKEAVKSLLAFGTIAATIAGLFDANDDWNVETDPRSSDFMKLRTGNTRYDILGGFGQYITLGSRLATNETKTTLGEVKELGKQLGDKNRLDVLLTFLENKGSPVTTYVMDYLRGKNAIGEPFDQTWKIPATEVNPSFELRKAEISRFIPLFLQDAVSLMHEKGTAKGAAMVAPAVFGVGVQNYGDNNGGTALKDRYSSDPTVQEIQRLAGDKEIVSTGDRGDAKKYGLDKLADEQIKQYRDYSAELIIAATKEAMVTEEWQQATDEERKDWVSTIGKDMRELAQEDLFGTPQEEEMPEDEYDDE